MAFMEGILVRITDLVRKKAAQFSAENLEKPDNFLTRVM